MDSKIVQGDVGKYQCVQRVKSTRKVRPTVPVQKDKNIQIPFQIELHLLLKVSRRLDEVDAIRFARAVASQIKDLTSLKEMWLDGHWH